MIHIKQFIALFLNRKFFKKLFAYLLLIVFIIVLQDFIGIFFLTFIFAYLAYSGAQYLYQKLQSCSNKHPVFRFLAKYSSVNIIICLEYALSIAMIVFILHDILPQLLNEVRILSQSEFFANMPFLRDSLLTIQDYLEIVRDGYSELGGAFEQLLVSQDYLFFESIFENLKTVGVIFLKWILSLVLSFVFIMDRERLDGYLLWIKKSNFKFLYAEYSIIFDKVVKSFGLILRAQSMIAFANAIMTSFWLLIIGIFFGDVFPFLLTLGLMVFIFGFVPIIWAFISSIPIVFIAYSSFGLSAWIAALVLVLLVHIVEAYYLNPKIVSTFFNIPMSLTFVILLVSEHFFWLIGLLVWVSLFYFLMWLLSDINHAITKTKRKMIQQVSEK